MSQRVDPGSSRVVHRGGSEPEEGTIRQGFGASGQIDFIDPWVIAPHPVSGKRTYDLHLAAQGGAPEPVIADDPDDPSARRLLLLSNAQGLGSSALQLDIVHAWVGRLFSSPGTLFPKFICETQVKWDATPGVGERVIFLRSLDQGDALLWEVAFETSTGAISTRVGAGPWRTSALALARSVWGTVLVDWKAGDVVSAGHLRVYLDGLLLADASHEGLGTRRLLDTLDLTCSAGVPATTMFRWFSTATSDEWDRWIDRSRSPALYRDQGALGIAMDGDQTRQAIFAWFHPGQYRADWLGRSLDADVQLRLAGDATWLPGPTMDLESDTFYGNSIVLTGLEPDTTYEYRLVVHPSDDPSDTFVSGVRSFRTLAQRCATMTWMLGSCQHQSGQLYPHLAYRIAADEGCQRALMIGDVMYSDNVADIPTAPQVDAMGYWQEYIKSLAWSRYIVDFTRSRQLYMMPDDHEIYNDFDASWRRGYATPRNPTGADGSTADLIETDGIARGSFFEQGRKAFYLWFGKTLLDLPVQGVDPTVDDWIDTEFYRSFSTDHTRLAMLDTRSFMDNTGTEPTSDGRITMLGPDQQAWFNGMLASNRRDLVVIASPTLWGEAHSRRDTWDARNAPPGVRIARRVERNGLEQTFQSAPRGRAAILSGDVHLIILHSQFTTATGGRTRDADRFLFELCCSGIAGQASGSFDGRYVPPAGSLSDLVHFTTRMVDFTNATIRTFAVVKIDEPTGTIRTRIFNAENGNLMHDQAFTYPATSADFDQDGDADVDDFFSFVGLFQAGDERADLSGDGRVDLLDFFAFVNLFAMGGC